MRTFSQGRSLPILTAIVALALVLSASLARGETVEPIVLDAEELESFTVDAIELFPPNRDGAQVEYEDPVTRLVPPEPADTASPALNLVPLPAPLAPAVIGVFVVALRLATRRGRPARVFRKRI